MVLKCVEMDNGIFEKFGITFIKEKNKIKNLNYGNNYILF